VNRDLLAYTSSGSFKPVLEIYWSVFDPEISNNNMLAFEIHGIIGSTIHATL